MGKILYTLKQKKNPLTKQFEYYATKFNTGANTIDTRAMFAAMAEYAHIPPAQIPAAFNAIVKAIEAFCLNGHSVTIPDLGTFRITISSAGAQTEEEFEPSMIRGIKMRFLPDAKLNYELRANTQFIRSMQIGS